MTVHSFHLAEVPAAVTARALARPLTAGAVPGLRHAESLAVMQLGAPTVSPARMQLGRIAVFAAWDGEAALDRFLAEHPLGARLATGGTSGSSSSGAGARSPRCRTSRCGPGPRTPRSRWWR